MPINKCANRSVSFEPLGEIEIKMLCCIDRAKPFIEVYQAIECASEVTYEQRSFDKLWEFGYVERLGANPLLVIFPFLRSAKRKRAIPCGEEFVTLTIRGYFTIHPFIQWRGSR